MGHLFNSLVQTSHKMIIKDNKFLFYGISSFCCPMNGRVVKLCFAFLKPGSQLFIADFYCAN